MKVIVDLGAALDRLDGDRELLAEMVEVFLRTAPARLLAVREAIARDDGPALELAAHSLRGAAASLSATAVVAAARSLEQLGHDRELTDSEATCIALEIEVARLLTALVRMTLPHEQRGVATDRTPHHGSGGGRKAA